MIRILTITFSMFAALSAHAAVVFDNTSTPTGMVNALLLTGETASYEHGSEVTLAGGERMVTNFAMRLRLLGSGPATFTMQVRFHRNDGAGGAPQTLLWDSGMTPGVIDSGADLQYSFVVPNVRVPASFTWSVRVIGRTGNMSMMGPALYSPPTVGSALVGFWRNVGVTIPSWVFIHDGEPPFSAKVTAERIPGDVDVNGTVNVSDLLGVINAWGACAPPCPPSCPADFNGDCTVNVTDLLAVINNWG